MAKKTRGQDLSWAKTGLVCASLLLGLTIGARGALAEPKTTTVENPEYAAAVDELNRISEEYVAIAQQQDQTATQLDEVRQKISDNESNMADVKQDIDDCKETLAQKREMLAHNIADDYKSGGVNLLAIVLSSTSFEETFSKIYYFTAVRKSEAEMIASINDTKDNLQKQQDELSSIEKELSDQEADISALFEEQNQQAQEMLMRQAEATALVNSLPPEIQQQLDEDSSDLVSNPEFVEMAGEQGNAEQTEPSNGEDKSEEQEKQQDKKDDESTPRETNKEQEKKKDDNANSTPAPTSTTTPSTDTTGDRTYTGAFVSQQKTLPLSAVIDSAYATTKDEPLRTNGGCFGWVYCTFRNTGYAEYQVPASHATDRYLFSSNIEDLRPGMIIRVTTHNLTASGRLYGHMGIYIGNNTVRHLSAREVREMPLDKWISTYGTTVSPVWGWYLGVPLA